MIAEIGHIAVILAFVIAIVQMIVPMIGAQRRWSDWMELAVPAAQAQFALTAIAFAALVYAFVVSDFSIRLVATNSHSLKPMLYKVTGTWGNHEGSMLLWILILTLFGACVAWFGSNLPLSLKARVLAVQSAIAVAFFAFLLFTSNPFERLPNPPFDGQDLNPLLQDPGLAFHPPFLYLGYVGLSMAFSFAVAALIEGRVDAAWARWVRPWTLAAWMFLTIGIALGSWWAYYELGWGGWWFWDPVENASFMPWLLAAALLHSAIVVEKRDTLKSWTVLLAILAFSFSLIGTFIVRSGVITSVHAFANDPARGVFILGILAVTIGSALTLYAARAGELRSSSAFSTVSRESSLVLNNLLLAVSCAVVFIGTIWPLVVDYATNGETVISVGPPFFDMAFTPFMIALAVLLPIGSMLPWKRGDLGRVAPSLWAVALLAFVVAALVWVMQTGGSMLAPIGIALAVWLVAGATVDISERVRLGRIPFRHSLRRISNLPRADFGKYFAHVGFGLTVFGIAAITAWETEDIRTLQPGEAFEFGGYTFELEEVRAVQGPNYQSQLGIVRVLREGVEETVLTPEKRFYPVQRMPTTEASINLGFTRDLYVVLGDRQPDGAWAIRTYIKPYVNWIWIGSGVMSLGGLISLMDRRFRVGAVSRRRVNPVPAE